MRFQIFQNKHGQFYAKRHVFWFFWKTVTQPDFDSDFGGESPVFRSSKEKMIAYLYDMYLDADKEDELVADFRI